MANQPFPFHAPWHLVDLVFLDFETTGVRPGIDRVCEVGLARYHNAELMSSYGSRINPGVPIPAEATAIHGIANSDVRDKPTLAEFFESAITKDLLANAQPGAYNAPFDKSFCPPTALADWSWPWIDTLTLVRTVDRFARGAGRHKLSAACERHGVLLENAHSAEDDAKAAGHLFHVLIPKMAWAGVAPHREPSLGHVLTWMRKQEADQWADFQGWLANQLPLESATS